jgi:hypothetical protein
LLARIDEVTPDSLRARIAANAASLSLWRDLARLRDDVPLPTGPRFAAFTDEARARVRRLFEGLEFRSLQPRLATLA